MHRFIPPSKGEKSSRSTASNQAGLEFPTLITIFSAPNYCGTYDNKGAYFLLDNGMVRLKTFNDTQPPYDLPFGLNALSWSVPFMASHVLQMQSHFIMQALGSKKKQRE
jgi:serine/threonine-protein phosphatase 2B catalytic subunit